MENNDRFNYSFLGRLQCDCEYYLNFGNRNAKHCLWFEDEQEHVNAMKEIYNNFPDDKKPQWISYERILEYEKQMVQNNE